MHHHRGYFRHRPLPGARFVPPPVCTRPNEHDCPGYKGPPEIEDPETPGPSPPASLCAAHNEAPTLAPLSNHPPAAAALPTPGLGRTPPPQPDIIADR